MGWLLTAGPQEEETSASAILSVHDCCTFVGEGVATKQG